MSLRVVHVFIILLFLVSCNVEERNKQFKREYPTIDFPSSEFARAVESEYKAYMVTINDFVSDDVLDQYEDLETISTEKAPLFVLKLVYKIKANIVGNNLVVNSILNIDPSIEKAKNSLSLTDFGFKNSLGSAGDSKVSLDSMLTFGDYSEYVGIKLEDEIVAYFFIARYDKLVILYTVVPGHSQVNFTEILRQKLTALEELMRQTKESVNNK